MFEKLLSPALAILLTIMAMPVCVRAQLKTAKAPPQADQIKAKVTRLGTGRQAQVEVRLKDNSKLKGYIGKIGEERFTVIDPKRGTVTPAPYDQVQQIKDTNTQGLRALAVGASVVGGLMLVVFLVLRGSD